MNVDSFVWLQHGNARDDGVACLIYLYLCELRDLRPLSRFTFDKRGEFRWRTAAGKRAVF